MGVIPFRDSVTVEETLMLHIVGHLSTRQSRVSNAPISVVEPLESRCLFSGAAGAITRTVQLDPGGAGIVAGESESVAQIFAEFAGGAFDEAAADQYTATVKFTGQPAQSISPSFDDMGALNLSVDVPTFARPGTYSAVIKVYRNAKRLAGATVAIPVTQNSTLSRADSDSPFGGKGLTIATTAGTSFTRRLGRFTSEQVGPEDASPTEVSIDWGDGTTTDGTFTDVGGGGEVSPGASSEIFAVSGAHAYVKSGRYRIRISATYSDSGSDLVIDDTAIVGKR